MDILSRKERSYRMSLVRSKETKPEQSVRRIIKHFNYKYLAHQSDILGSPDFAFPRRKKAIFVHGCFWHQHGRCRKDGQPRIPKTRLDYWGKKLTNNQRRDAIIQKKLKKMGWKYLIIWECQIKNKAKLAKLPNRIEKFMQQTGRT